VTPERWSQLREIFGKALELPESERSGLLQSACRGDSGLRLELERLLAESSATSWQSPAALFSAVARLAPGETLAHFQIEAILGEGGMGIVYRAYDTRLHRLVALKVLRPEHVVDPEWRRRLIREARAASGLNHPNIVTIYEIGPEDSVDFISMEYVEGRPLAQSIPPHGLPLARALDYATAMAEALTKAHAAGVIHRDLKPANIMVTAEGHIKVLDFGLARQQHPREMETATIPGNGEVAGTPRYMSPEQIRGLKADARTDIFSLGLILYEMITGRRPFDGDTASEAMLGILEKDPVPLAHSVPAAPGELQRIVHKALKKNPEERYQVCKDLELDLKHLRQQIGPDGLGARRSAIRTRGRVKIAGVSAALLAIATGAYFYFHRAPAIADRNSVLVADFVNTTSEPVFDGTLRTALAIQLEQSPYLRIFPDAEAHDTLRFMGQQPDESITKNLGREICQRKGIEVLLAGAIAGLGSHYVITLEAITAATGDVIAQQQVEAESKERVLHVLGEAATALRRTLGESAGSLRKYDRPLEIGTTSSLEALKAWSISRDLNAKGKPREAIPYARRAIDLDPNFAMAYRGLAIYHLVAGDQAEPLQFIQKAFELRERASEMEKLLIAGDYYKMIPEDLDKARETLELLNRIYPHDAVSHNELGGVYSRLGDYENAAEQMRESLRLMPSAPVYDELQRALFRMNRFVEAKQAIDQAMAQHIELPFYHSRLFAIAFVTGDAAGMQQQVAWAEAQQPKFPLYLNWQRDAAAFHGQMKLSRTFGNSLVREAMYGECPNAKDLSARPSSIRGSSDDAIWTASLALALCGDADGAQSAADVYAQARPPTASIESGCKIPTLRAAIALARNQPAQTIELLEPARRFGGEGQGWPEYLRGLAYLKLKSSPQATAEFQYILDHRGFQPYSQPYAYLGLARAAFLDGDNAKSRRAYQNLFAIWKDPDPDLPLVIEARSEYEKLPR
jgi:tetratricopeptide (TPR) repeat protein